MGIFDKGVKKTNRGFFDRLSRAIVGKAQVDEDLLDAIEEALLATDMGVDTTMKIIITSLAHYITLSACMQGHTSLFCIIN